ncbi:MAG: alanine--tRNA ligase [Phycisphaerales bacterium JB039]
MGRPTSAQIRQSFIDFFRTRTGAEHTHVPSAPVVPHADPTLLFTNAGMNQFKPLFLGQVEPGSSLEGLQRAVNSQKCIRAGGKHNDLEDVGKDTYHHTFFEMLGNWSFGDYVKAEAIACAWEYLTGTCGILPDRLYATYFGGDEAGGLAPDDEARELWLRHLPPERVLPGSMKDNFWEMGETGPCGPCSEIHYDRVGGRDAAGLVNADDPSVLEIWNLVFIQFDRQESGELRPLPAKHVDTGMGLERLCSILQNTTSNYDTDLFFPLFEAIEHFTGVRPYEGRVGAADPDRVDMAYRVIADHIRTLTFAITDGAVPSNEGRGYVLRRILRRAVRFGSQMLHAKPGLLSQLVPVVVEHMGEAFPELRKNPQRVREIVLEEEESFARTLDRGFDLFEGAATRAGDRLVAEEASRGNDQPEAFVVEQKAPELRSQGDRGKYNTAGVDWRAHDGAHPVITAEDAFQLYDTYGFPLDLTQMMAEERGLSVDTEGFERLMEEQRDRARAAAKTASAGLALDGDAIVRLKRLNVRPTDDSDKYHARAINARIRAIWTGATFDETVSAAEKVRRIGIVLDRTCFYAEAGGQVGDVGRLQCKGGEFRVEDTQAFGGYVLHIGAVVRGQLKAGETVQVNIDNARRLSTAANHTATHMMNFALRRALGEGADQKGSLVAPDRLRFDFDATHPVAPEQLAAVEQMVRRQIEQDLTVYADIVPLMVGRQINGLRAVFGEKYPDPVRIVSIGQPVQDIADDPAHPAWGEVSIEFCGGTHLASTSQAEAFCITQEEAVAKGVRRVVALTRAPARAAIEAAEAMGRRIEAASDLDGAELASEAADIAQTIDELTMPVSRKAMLRDALADLQERVKLARKQAAKARAAEAVQAAQRIAAAAQTAGDRVVITTIDLGDDRGALQQAARTIQDTLPAAAVMLLSPDEYEGKVSVIASCPKPAISAGLRAGDWVREVAQVLGGKGGGRPELAQGGGSDISKVREAIKHGRAFAHRALG